MGADSSRLAIGSPPPPRSPAFASNVGQAFSAAEGIGLPASSSFTNWHAAFHVPLYEKSKWLPDQLVYIAVWKNEPPNLRVWCPSVFDTEPETCVIFIGP